MGDRSDGNFFPAIMAKVEAAFPEFDEGAVRHASNKITNKIRRGHFDCWRIDIGRAPMDDDGQYVHFEVEAKGVTVYVRVTVD
ncbi:hypothetical protein [Burkholderia stabilis]|uniref:hypothetical protein n=1 Tax=Burkholderia stabilis TaxID=95485 RepID=UPI001F4B61AD|nr:hypothetical protein [Burkholderia stabilis]